MNDRIAVYGGTFDPFHLGHLIPTVRAQETFRFEAVHFVPARKPPHREDELLTPVTHRFAMVATATLPFSGFFASDHEINRSGPSYTVDTVRHFLKLYPDRRIYFLMGSDSFSQISTWHRWEDLVELTNLVVLHRAHIWGDELLERVPESLRSRVRTVVPFEDVPDPDGPTVYLLDHEPFPISATQIRERQARGVPIRELVPHEVHSYIEKYGFYSEREARGGR